MSKAAAIKMLDAFTPLLVRSHCFSALTIDIEYHMPIVDMNRPIIAKRRDYCRHRATSIDAQMSGTIVERNGGSSEAMAWRMLAEILDLALQEPT